MIELTVKTLDSQDHSFSLDDDVSFFFLLLYTPKVTHSDLFSFQHEISLYFILMLEHEITGWGNNPNRRLIVWVSTRLYNGGRFSELFAKFPINGVI